MLDQWEAAIRIYRKGPCERSFGGPELMDVCIEGAVQKRIAEPAEIIGPALFLASDASAFMTGTVMMCDGGWSA